MDRRSTSEETSEHPVPSDTDTLSVVVFSLDGQRYGLPLVAAERALPMASVSPLPGCPDAVLGAINVHGDVTPVFDLRERLGLAPRAYGPDDRLLLARTARRVVALPVDEVHGVADVASAQVVSPDTVLPGVGRLAGIAALADGLLLIDDLAKLLSPDEEGQLDAALDEAAR